MRIDPFDGVGKLPQEIGQPTFVELIYVRRHTVRPAIPQRQPDVQASVARLAFGRPRGHGTRDPSDNRIPETTQPQAIRYVTGGSDASSSIRAKRIADELSSMISNLYVPFDFSGCRDGLINSVRNPSFREGLAEWVDATTGADLPPSSWDRAMKAMVVGNPTLGARQQLSDLPPNVDLRVEADFAAIGPALPGRWWRFTLTSQDVPCLDGLVAFGSDHTYGPVWAALSDSKSCPGTKSYGRVRVFMSIVTDQHGRPVSYIVGLGFGTLENSSTTLSAEMIDPDDFLATIHVEDPAAPQPTMIKGVVFVRVQRTHPPVAVPNFWPVCANLPLLLNVSYNGRPGTLYWNGNGWFGRIAGISDDGPLPVFIGLNNYSKASQPLYPDTTFRADIGGGLVLVDASPASTCSPFRQEFNIPDNAGVTPGSLVAVPATTTSELQMTASDVTGNILNSKTFSAAQVGTRVSMPFTVPSDGKVVISFHGVDGATAKVTNVSCCVPASVCWKGHSKVSYHNFMNGRGGWSGGALRDGMAVLTGSDRLRQTFSDLDPNVMIVCSVVTNSPGGFVIEFHSSAQTDTYTSSDYVGAHAFATRVPPDGTVTIIIRPKAHSVAISEILLCKEVPLPCDAGMTSLRTFIEWRGIPRQPTNIFNMFARVTFRDPGNPFRKKIAHIIPIRDGRLGLVVPTSCTQKTTCDFWKQQGDDGMPQDMITGRGLAVSLLGSVRSGQVVSVRNRRNWLWSVPASTVSTVQDSLISLWPDPMPGLIESIEFFVLMHNVNLLNPGDSGACRGAHMCGPDPANELKFTLRYKNAKGLEREFSQTISRISMYQTHVADTDAWATLKPLGFGLRGRAARWESFLFSLDTVDGKGLDQCSTPLIFTTTGSGTMNLEKPRMNGLGHVTRPCVARVDVEVIQEGYAINEIQEVILPRPTGGRWKLTVHRDGIDETATLPWNATPQQVRDRLGRLRDTIGSPDNVKVTRADAAYSYRIEFQNDLAGRTFRLMRADGSELAGINDAYVIKLRDGTKNERQTIHKGERVTASLIIAFRGRESAPIPYNASLNAMQAALEAIPTIGPGNVMVTGSIQDRTAPYSGPWHVDFVGVFAGQNVGELEPRTSGYDVKVDWHGGTGANDIQQIVVIASDGTFRLTLRHPDDSGSATTGNIPAKATAAAVAAAIIGSVPWITSNDIIVRKIADDDPYRQSWTVEFTGQYAARPIPLMEIDGRKLKGGEIIVRRVQEGAGRQTRHRLTVRKANGGTYRLSVTIGNESYTSPMIVWNATPEGLKEALVAMSVFKPDDVVVKGDDDSDPDVSAAYIISFHRKFGNVPPMVPDYEKTLLCDPLPLLHIQSPPYNYRLEECDKISDGCSPQHPLCRPGEGEDAGDEVERCPLHESANTATQLVFQRDLFDPNQEVRPGQTMTIRDIVHKKGLIPGDYIPYLRYRETLIATDYSRPVETKMQILLVEAAIDSDATRERILRHLRDHRHILPMRMVWRQSYSAGMGNAGTKR